VPSTCQASPVARTRPRIDRVGVLRARQYASQAGPRGGRHADEQHVVVGCHAAAGRGDVGEIAAQDRAAGYRVR